MPLLTNTKAKARKQQLWLLLGLLEYINWWYMFAYILDVCVCVCVLIIVTITTLIKPAQNKRAAAEEHSKVQAINDCATIYRRL